MTSVFFRPVTSSHQRGQASSQLGRSPNVSLDNAYLRPDMGNEIGNEARHSVWSNSQLSELHPAFIQQESSRTEQLNPTPATEIPEPKDDAHSCPDDDSPPDSMSPGEFKIIIHRTDSSRPKTAGEIPQPPLETSIPHYRLGTPRFSAEGTPMLRSSINTKTSTSDDPRSSIFVNRDRDREKLLTIPRLGGLNKNLHPGDDRLSSISSMLSSDRAKSEAGRISTAPSTTVFYKLSEPVDPGIFDTLASNMDDQSVVRYVHGTKEITAANPARIIAQISSESFMDYELVSDFFLTFRSYLSASNLLSLLLARLEWAINRPQEDGRIIRIRTFAALRHWILNYFVDDFVASRELRVQFCNKINTMYIDVKANSHGGNSDLKILLDLKKCWNGRCSLYWDSEEFVTERHPDDVVVPGGLPKIRDSRVERLSQINSFSPMSPQGEATFTKRDTEMPVLHAETQTPPLRFHTREMSSTSNDDVPNSSASESSIQALSCSIPARASKSSSPLSSAGRALHPVPVAASRHTSPINTPNPLGPTPTTPTWRRPMHSHKRSGSFSDSVRDDRAPLPLYNLDRGQPQNQWSPFTGSLVRGNLCAPLPPYVDVVSPPSPSLQPSYSHFTVEEAQENGMCRKSFKRDSSDSNQKQGGIASPGVKTIIGSIRRALHSKPAGSNIPQQTAAPNQPSLKGKTSALPLNVAFGSEAYRERRAANGQKSHIRADLLCDEAAQCYRKVVTDEPRKQNTMQNDAIQEVSNERPKLTIQVDTQVSRTSTRGQPSQITNQRESAVVPEDAGLGIPAMSGALRPSDGHNIPLESSNLRYSTMKGRSKSASPGRKTVGPSASDLKIPPGHPEAARSTIPRPSRPSHRDEEHVAERTSSAERRQSKRGSMSTVLRKYASYQSGIMRLSRRVSTDTMSGASSPQNGSGKPTGRMLRRRPGGDLRKIQNVQDLEPVTQKQSFDSQSSVRCSTNESVLYMGNVINDAPPTNALSRGTTDNRRDMELPLAEAHSSKRMKPSFEAAVAEFSQIPDADDGGIESTLLKLEGKWEPSPPATSEGPSFSNNQQDSGDGDQQTQIEEREAEGEKTYREQHTFESPHSETQGSSTWDSSSAATPGYLAPSDRRGITSQFSRNSIPESEDSYCSIPLLERGLSDDSMRKRKSSLHPSNQDDEVENRGTGSSTESSIEMVEKTESLKRIAQGQTLPDSSVDKEDNFSDLSSELSTDHRNKSVRTPSGPRFAESPEVTVSGPLGSTHPSAHPPSPPMTTHTQSMVSYSDPSKFQARPLTPDPSPVHKNEPHSPDRKLDMQSNVLLNSEMGSAQNPPRVPPNYNHIPFILACDSQILAQQLTLVEKAALSEIDWRDLVDLKWTNYSPHALNWAEYLASDDHKGIDLVVARFNLMVKWVLSEIVLTQDIHERARAISKFIHVAVHSRRMHNYSTMLQIAMALSSVDCTRLVKTWELVAPPEKRLLRDMESLIQPVRNFHGLRAEIESVNLQEGCIPFVGKFAAYT